MISSFYHLLSKPMGAIVNTCTNLFKNLKSSTQSCIADSNFPISQPKKQLIEVNPKGVHRRTVIETPKKSLLEQPKALFPQTSPLQQKRYDRLRRHFHSDEVDFFYRRAFNPISPMTCGPTESEISDPGVLVQRQIDQSANIDCHIILHELADSVVLVQVPASQSATTSSELSDSGVLVQPPPSLRSRLTFSMGPFSFVRAYVN